MWCPKYRKKLFKDRKVRERAGQLVGEISAEYGFDVSEVKVATDHVHILLSFPPSRSIGEVVRVIKSKTARGLFREFPSLKRKLWAGELWEDGYFARTVGSRMTRDIIERYIQHHQQLQQGPAQLGLELR